MVRGTFLCSAAFALAVLVVRGNVSDATPVLRTEAESGDTVEVVNEEDSVSKEQATKRPPSYYTQPLLRTIALAAGWSLTLSVAIYSLFASRFLGYAQSQLSLTYSAGAATVIATQLWIVPRLVKTAGEHLSCSIGLWALAAGLAGASVVRSPLSLHVGLYLLVRAGQGITDTATATLVARSSRGNEERARNLGMIQSTRAGARIFTPVLSGSLFLRSCQRSVHFPGALPYLINSALALALSPLPFVLQRLDKKVTTDPNK